MLLQVSLHVPFGLIDEPLYMIFKGLGTLGIYYITLQGNCTPAINPPRCIPHSLKGRLQQVLEKNVKLGVTVYKESRSTHRLG